MLARACKESLTLDAFFDRPLRLLTLGSIPHPQDHLGRVEAGEVASCFKPKANVGSGHNNRLSCEVMDRIRRGHKKLVFQKDKKICHDFEI